MFTCKFNYSESEKKYYSNINNNEYKNCYEICPYYYYYDIFKNKTFCTEYSKCPNDYYKLIEEKKECINDYDNDLKNMENTLNDCLDNEKNTKKEIYCYDTILKNIDVIYTSKFFDTSDIDNGHDEIIKVINFIFCITIVICSYIFWVILNWIKVFINIT